MRWLAAVLLALCSQWAVANSDYKLGPGDQVQIRVFGQPDLNIDALLGKSGVVSYPFLGELTLTGLTVKEVEQLIYSGLKGDYLVEPNVYAQVVSYRPFYIHGEVEEPGAYPYQPGLTVDQAIALAGGLTERASTDKIFLLSEQQQQAKRTKASLQSQVAAGDTIKIEQRFF